MKGESNTGSDASLWKWIGEWWLAKNRRRVGVAEVDNLDPALAIGISRELGTSVGEMRALAGKWPDSSPELLARRLESLDLNRADIDRTQPAAARDLAVHCSLCADKTRCRHDLDHNPNDPAWRDYCVNTVTLTALKDERDARTKKDKP